MHYRIPAPLQEPLVLGEYLTVLLETPQPLAQQVHSESVKRTVPRSCLQGPRVQGTLHGSGALKSSRTAAPSRHADWRAPLRLRRGVRDARCP